MTKSVLQAGAGSKTAVRSVPLSCPSTRGGYCGPVHNLWGRPTAQQCAALHIPGDAADCSRAGRLVRILHTSHGSSLDAMFPSRDRENTFNKCARVVRPLLMIICLIRGEGLVMLCRARAAIPDRDLQLRLIHMLMGSSRGATSSSTAVPASPSNSSDSNTQKHNASPTPTTASHMSDSVCMRSCYNLPATSSIAL